VIVVKRLYIRLTNESHETLDETCEKLGVTMNQFVNEAIFSFLVENSHPITRRMQKHFNKNNLKEDMHELHFLSNFQRRINQHCVPRMMLMGVPPFAVVNKIVGDAENYYLCLKKENQELLKEDLKYLQQFKERKFFESWCETHLPDQAKALLGERRKIK